MWSAPEIIFAAVVAPVAIPVWAAFASARVVKSNSQVGAKYLIDSAGPDIVRLAEKTWNRSELAQRERDVKARKTNAEAYNGIALGPREFRLVTLYPRERLSAIDIVECEATIASREAFHDYQAVSYAWGDTALTHRIKLNDKDFMVTKNLHQALKALRGTSPYTLWIDAICINQADDKERSEQVEQMQATIQGAINVIVWLGDAPKGFQRIAPLFEGPVNGVFEDDRGPTGHIFLELLQRPWWERMWVVQELLLAHKVSVNCGRHRFTWTQFEQLIELYWKDSGDRSDHVQNAMTMIETRARWQMNNGSENGLLDLAWQFRERKAFDDRDKLYALFGLLPQNERSLVADYTKPPREVYREFAQAWINQHKSLLIMFLAQRQPREGHYPWYPVWSDPFHDSPEFFCGSTFNKHPQNFWDGKFFADGGKPPSSCILDANKSILNLKGFIYDTISDISPTICQPSRTGAEVDMKTCIAAWKSFVLQSKGSLKSNPKDLEQAFLLAVTAGLFDPTTMANHEAVQIAACRDRRLFVTEKGEVGLGPAHTSVGDIVCVLYGSPVPVVLSQCKHCELNPQWELVEKLEGNQQPLHRPTCQFVGDAYFHKIMNYGIHIDRDFRAGRLRVQDFYFCG